MTTSSQQAQKELVEHQYADELARLRAHDRGMKPAGWQLSPQAVVDFICGSEELGISPKFIGDRAIVERCVVTLAGARPLLLVGEPGTAKSMLSELLSAAICSTSALTVQGSAGTTEDQLRYGWNYALLLAQGPCPEAIVDSPVLSAMRQGTIARIEEITRCQPEVQDSLVSVLSERRIAVPELDNYSVAARPGFCVIATANLRDTGVSEMSAALKRRFSFERIDPISDKDAETSLVIRKTAQAVDTIGGVKAVDQTAVECLVTIFRDLRAGRTEEGWTVEKTSSQMSTAEAIDVSTSIALSSAFFPTSAPPTQLVPSHMLSALNQDDSADSERLATYFDVAVQRRASTNPASAWALLWEKRDEYFS